MDLSVQNTSVTSQEEAPHLPHTKPDSFIKVALFAALVACGMALYLFWQNQQLSYQLALSRQVAASPSPSPTADPSAGWKSFSNDIFTLRYAPEVVIKNIPIPASNENPEYSLSIELDGTQQSVINILRKDYLYKTDNSPAHDLNLDEYLKWNLYSNCIDKNFGTLVGKLCSKTPYSENEYLFISKTNGRFIEALEYRNGDKSLLDQILSTFKFTN